MPRPEGVAMIVSGVTLLGTAVGIAHNVVGIRHERRQARQEAAREAFRAKVRLHEPSPDEVDRVLADHRAYQHRQAELTSSSPVEAVEARVTLGSTASPSAQYKRPSKLRLLFRRVFVYESPRTRRIGVLSMVAAVSIAVFMIALLEFG